MSGGPSLTHRRLLPITSKSFTNSGPSRLIGVVKAVAHAATTFLLNFPEPYRPAAVRSPRRQGGCGRAAPPAAGRQGRGVSGSSMSGLSSSSTLTSLNVTTRTFLTNRAGRYMSQTQASDIRTSK